MPVDPALVDHWRHLQEALLSLRVLLISDQAALADFDEYLDANEFELALHRICYFLLNETDNPASAEEIASIRSLHNAMEIVDQCVEELTKRSETDSGLCNRVRLQSCQQNPNKGYGL